MSWKFWKNKPVAEAPESILATSQAMKTLTRAAMSGADAIITPNEVNLKHGMGVLVERFFGGFTNVLSIRSQDSFDGEQNFGIHKLRISHSGLARWESYEELLRRLNGSTAQ